MRTYLYGVATGFCLLAAMTSCAKAAPGWKQTGGWLCKGGSVTIIHSNDGRGAINFFIASAWFDNNYTLRGNDLYYNGELCRRFGRPFMDNFYASPAPKRAMPEVAPECLDSDGEYVCGDK